jgi:hypothetical protein
MIYITILGAIAAFLFWINRKSNDFTVCRQTTINALPQDIFPCDNQVKYTIVESGGSTSVTWAMSGKNAFIHKLMQTFLSMDNMVGKEFERGLAALKLRVEQKKVN